MKSSPARREPLLIETYLAVHSPASASPTTAPSKQSLFAIAWSNGHVFITQVPVQEPAPTHGFPIPGSPLALAQVEAAAAVIVMADRILGPEGGTLS